MKQLFFIAAGIYLVSRIAGKWSVANNLSLAIRNISIDGSVFAPVIFLQVRLTNLVDENVHLQKITGTVSFADGTKVSDIYYDQPVTIPPIGTVDITLRFEGSGAALVRAFGELANGRKVDLVVDTDITAEHLTFPYSIAYSL